MPVDLLVICLLAAFLSIDVRTIGGTMLSRPLVVAPLTGLLLKDHKTGFHVAYFIELVWVGMLPVGASLPVEVLPVTVVSVYLASTFIVSQNLVAGSGVSPESIIMFCIIISIPVGFMSRWLESHIRELNSRFSDYLDREVSEERIPNVEMITYMNIAVTFLKGFLVCFIPIFFGHHVLLNVYNSLPDNVKAALGFSFYLVPLVGIAVVMEIFFMKKYTLHFALSFIAVFVFSLFTRVSPFLIMALSILAAMLLLYLGREKKKAGV